MEGSGQRSQVEAIAMIACAGDSGARSAPFTVM